MLHRTEGGGNRRFMCPVQTFGHVGTDRAQYKRLVMPVLIHDALPEVAFLSRPSRGAIDPLPYEALGQQGQDEPASG